MKKVLSIAIAAAVSGLLVQPVMAEETATNSVKDAIQNGKVDLNFRYRFENVDQDPITNKANASTLRSRLTYTTAVYKDFQAQVEVDNVSNIGNANHRSSGGDATPANHPVVADPTGTEGNQAWIAYTGLKDTVIKHGLQRVNLDNQRFIGGVAWRQNEQTYNATALINSSLPDTTIVYAYVSRINDIFGRNISTDSNLLNISYKGLGFGKLSAYKYQLADLTDTTGIRLAGSPKISDLKLHYELEYANQVEDDGVATKLDADYTHVVIGATFGSITAKLGQEVLGSDNTNGGSFQTHLGTKHKFNGWADKFLGTPTNGLDDKYALVSTKVAGVKLTAVYHDFNSDQGNVDYGSEINLAAATKVADNVKLLVKYADYSKGDTATTQTDTKKLWLQAQVNF